MSHRADLTLARACREGVEIIRAQPYRPHCTPAGTLADLELLLTAALQLYDRDNATPVAGAAKTGTQSEGAAWTR